MDPVNVPAKFEVCSFTRSWDNSDWSFGWVLRIVEGPMSSRKNLMLIFGDWLDCVLEGIILQKKSRQFFKPFPCTFLSNLNNGQN